MCNSIDDDCNDSTPDDVNADGDPRSVCNGDCDDSDPDVYPGHGETTCDFKDNDCNANTLDDPNADGDPDSLCDGDCDDNDPARYPSNTETMCNSIDDDCNDSTPDDVNADGDPRSLCQNDCNDNDPNVYPGHAEILCNGKDDDCNASSEDSPNADSDPVGYCFGDCNDNDADIYPGATEVCDNKDNDCDLDTDLDPITGDGVCGIGEDCSNDSTHCSGDMYCQPNSNDGRTLCSHWCNNSHEVPGDTDNMHECPLGFSCIPYANTDSAGYCWPNSGGALDTGSVCTSDSDCRSDMCWDVGLGSSRCVDACSSIVGCSFVSGWSCILSTISYSNGDMSHGICKPMPGSGSTGDTCLSDSDCRDGFCDPDGYCENFCCRTESCPTASHYYCQMWGGSENSLFKACYWDGGWSYGSALDDGSACNSNSDCKSHLCFDAGDGLGQVCRSFCCRNGDCPTGMICDTAIGYDISGDGNTDALGRCCVMP